MKYKKPITKAALYLADREKGMTYKQIAEKHGISKQRVAQVCGQYKECQFRAYSEKDVIYPNWRKWLNDNKVSRSEFARRMGNLAHPHAITYLSKWMRGYTYPTKQTIDMILEITGLTYEELWEVDHA